MEDELHEVRERFYIGAFGAALEHATKTQCRNDLAETEKRALEARCYLATGKYSQLKDLRDSPEPGQRCTALMAMFIKAKDGSQKQRAYDQLMELAKTSKDPAATYLTTCAMVQQGDVVEAINLLQGIGQTAEVQALKLQLYLAIHRNDLATKQMKDLAAISDDHAISKISSAFVHVATGNYQEAFLLYTDLEAQYGDDMMTVPSSAILNGKACANLQRGNFAEVPEDLNRVFETSPSDTDTLINLCAASIYLGKDEDATKYLGFLRKCAPEHAICKKIEHMENSFANFV